MGLFNRLGREVEKFKQNAQEAAEEAKGGRCPECDATPGEQAGNECPECGATLETADD